MTLSGMNYSDDSEDEVENIDPYRRKYQLLSERCEVLQQDNERLAFRTQQTRRNRRLNRKLRKALMERLDKYGDGWRTVSLTLPDPTLTAVVKTEKISPKTSPNKGLPAPKGSGSESKSPPKVTKSVASGSGSKRKSQPKSEKVDLSTAKRPLNPFFIFCIEQQQLILEQRAEQYPGEPEPTKAELNKMLASKWNTLTSDERKVYFSLFETSKEKYLEDVATYKRDKLPT